MVQLNLPIHSSWDLDPVENVKLFSGHGMHSAPPSSSWKVFNGQGVQRGIVSIMVRLLLNLLSNTVVCCSPFRQSTKQVVNCH